MSVSGDRRSGRWSGRKPGLVRGTRTGEPGQTWPGCKSVSRLSASPGERLRITFDHGSFLFTLPVIKFSHLPTTLAAL